MTNPNKWREWTLESDQSRAGWSWFVTHGHTEPYATMVKIHVIEAAPAIAEIDRLKRKVSLIHSTDMRNRGIHAQALAEIERLKAENESLYAANSEWSKVDCRTFGNLINENQNLTNQLAEARKIIESISRNKYCHDDDCYAETEATAYLKANGEG